LTQKGWKIALAASVALNLFAVTGGVAAWVAHRNEEARRMAAPRPESPGFRQMMESLDPSVRDRVRSSLRATAAEARPDFQEAREARQQAIALAASPDGDIAEIIALTDRSRAAESRARARMEHGAIPLLATLEPKDRKVLSEILRRRPNTKAPKPAAVPVAAEGPAVAVAPAVAPADAARP
jgi:uncharacterized membrane protein